MMWLINLPSGIPEISQDKVVVLKAVSPGHIGHRRLAENHHRAEGGCSSLYIALRGTAANYRFIACRPLPMFHGADTHVH